MRQERKKKQTPLSEFFRESPLEGVDLERDRSASRPVPPPRAGEDVSESKEGEA